MKNQLLNLKMIALMCLMMVLGGANVWAEDVTYTHTFKNGDFGKTTTATSYNATLTGVSWEVSASPNFGFLGETPLHIGSGNNPCESLILSSENISGTIKSVELETKVGSKGNRNLAVSVGGTNYTCNNKTSASLTTSYKKYKFVGNASGEIVISLTGGTKALYLKSLTIVYEGESQQGGNTLTISPAETSSVKAPIQVSLKASIDGSKIYYTTDNTDPTTESNLYSAPFEVTKSGTTVKALAVAEGADDVKAEATYTIKPDQPVFSDESKTFKDAFDVTLKLPETTDATSEIHYAIGAKATASSPKYEAPINISAENDGDKVILHAVVVDKFGNIGTEKVCTYIKSNAIVFDFTANPNVWSIEPSSNNDVPGDNVVAGKELKVDEVVMTSTNGKYSSSNATCIFKSTKGDVSLKVYIGATITFTAPVGYNISEILFDGKNLGNLSSEEETYTAPSWTGNAHSVQFSNSSKAVDIYTASIKLVAADPTYIAQNLKFIAKDGDDYYATFSSDKVTFITSKHVIPYVVTVTNGKIDMNSKMFKSEKATIGSEEVDGYYIPANTGILLYSDAENADYYTVENKTVDAFAESTNMLKPAPANGGVFDATVDYKYYKLAYGDWTNKTLLGFYWGADNGAAFYVKAGTAYLAVPASDATAKGFAFNGEATGIEGVNANVENAKAIYNLNGQRVASMAKPGLYIVNGKKVVRK